MKLSDYIKAYRKRMGLSQRKFASKCDLSNAYISMLENEVNPTTGEPVTPSVESLAKIAYGMGISLHQLMGEVDDCLVDITPREQEHDDTRAFLQNLSDEERTLFRLAKNAKPEAVRAAVAVLRSYEETNTEF